MHNLPTDTGPGGAGGGPGRQGAGDGPLHVEVVRHSGRRPGRPGVRAVRIREAVPARCLEAPSVDRVAPDYANNAVRLAAGGPATVWIFPFGGRPRRGVRNNVAADRWRLFAGVARGGIADRVEIVADCFGPESPAEAVARGYLGAMTAGADDHLSLCRPASEPETPARAVLLDRGDGCHL
jgi:hypothetical protein